MKKKEIERERKGKRGLREGKRRVKIVRDVIFAFLDAPSHLYMRSCPSVRPSVRRSVRPSVGPSRVIFEGGKYAY